VNSKEGNAERDLVKCLGGTCKNPTRAFSQARRFVTSVTRAHCCVTARKAWKAT